MYYCVIVLYYIDTVLYCIDTNNCKTTFAHSCTCVVITKYHRLDSLSNRHLFHLFFTVLEAGKSESMVPAWPSFVEGPLPALQMASYFCIHIRQREALVPLPVLIKLLTQSWGPPRMISSKLNYRPKSHLLTPSVGG